MQGISDIKLTVGYSKDNVMQIETLGIKDFVVKPFTGDDLIKRVENLLRL